MRTFRTMLATPLNFILVRGSRLRNRLYSLMIYPLFAACGRGSRICPPFRFANLRHVSLGKDVIINRDCWISTVLSEGDGDTAKLMIGNGTAIGMGATISSALSIVIEEQVLLARNVYISDHGHAFEDTSRPIKEQGLSRPAPVRIGRRTWLGQNVVVLPGVTIGEHCIIGANSVVRTAIPAFSVAVGVPARVVRRYNHQTAKWEKFASLS